MKFDSISNLEISAEREDSLVSISRISSFWSSTRRYIFRIVVVDDFASKLLKPSTSKRSFSTNFDLISNFEIVVKRIFYSLDIVDFRNYTFNYEHSDYDATIPPWWLLGPMNLWNLGIDLLKMHFRAPLILQTLNSITNVLFRCLSRIDSSHRIRVTHRTPWYSKSRIDVYSLGLNYQVDYF